tara:strand:+ start:207 stop:2507 length:2301 start_codon:yes stop_codon:yes gene_type:complete
MLPKIQHSISTAQSIDSKRYALSDKLKKEASTSSVLLSLKELPYKPFNRNSSIETAKELRQIELAQKDAPDWHQGEYAVKLDKDFLGIFEDYADKNNLVIDIDFIKRTLKDIDPFILGIKEFYGRPRPYQVNEYHGIEIDLDDSETAQTPAYPSGHALQGRLIYRILEKDNPSHSENLKRISDQISYARILRGVHFASDNEFGHEIVDKYIMPKLNKDVYLKSKASQQEMKEGPFRYKSSFENDVVASCVDGSCQRFNISEASLETLRPLIPEEVDLTKNIDLLGVAFNAAVVNKFNKNGDGIDTETALSINDYFINKPTNIEHNKEKVVGHIISAAFSDINTSTLLEPDQLKGTLDPFNIALGALVYKVVNPAFARMLEQTDEGENFHNKISASWEIGFNDFYIAIGSQDLNEAELIKDKKQIKEFKKYLKAYDGEGKMDDGTLVSRLVIGEIYPLGIGFTATPAAEVEGVLVENQQKIQIKKDKAAAEVIEVKNTHLVEKRMTTEKNSSLSEKNDVNMSNALIMDTKDLLEQIEGLLSDKLDTKLPEEAIASVSKVMMDAIKQKDELWQAEKSEKENALAEAKERHDALSTEVEEVKEKLVATEQRLEELADEKRLREAKDIFNSRMGVITEAFDLGEEDLKIVAAELAELEQKDDAFASYQEKLNVIWEHKTKAHIEAQEEAFKSRLEEAVAERLEALTESAASAETESQADSDQVIEEVLENVEEESSAAITNNNEAASAEDLSLREKFNKAFSSENIEIKY